MVYAGDGDTAMRTFGPEKARRYRHDVLDAWSSLSSGLQDRSFLASSTAESVGDILVHLSLYDKHLR